MTVANNANLPLDCPRCGARMRFLYARTPSGDLVGESAAAEAKTVYVYSCQAHGMFHFNRDIPVPPSA